MPEEEAVKEKPVERTRVSPETAKATMERLQKEGILPKKEGSPPPEKAFPQKPEKRAEILKSYPGEETIPADIKEELTEKARKLNTMAMGTGEASSEKPPVYQPPHLEAQGGAKTLKRIIEAEEKLEAARSGVPQPTAPLAPPPEKEVSIPSQDVAPAAAPWIKKEQPRMVGGTQEAAVRQVGVAPATKPSLPTREEVAAKQSLEQGQQIKRRWYERIPFLRALRGEKSPS